MHPVGDVDARSDDVLETRAGARKRFADDLEAERRLLVGALGRGRTVRGDRCRAGDVHTIADHDRA